MAEMFLDRAHAGRQLASRLESYKSTDTVVLAIPYGGVPVGVEVAAHLGVPLDVIFTRKLPIPWNPEAGFGAVTSGGTVVLNEELVREVGLTKEQVEAIVEEVRTGIRLREQVFRRELPEQKIEGRRVIIVDDGLASGYTMLAAAQAARRAGAQSVVVAVPVASESAVRLIGGSVDEMVCLIESHKLPFAVADYYVMWHDLTDDEVLQQIRGAVEQESLTQ